MFNRSFFKQTVFFIATLLISFTSGLFSENHNSTSIVPWMTHYEEAVEKSKETNKPLVLFFTGSDWCGWCTKLDEEVLETPPFMETAGQSFIFVKLDFPVHSPQDAQIKAQNKQLKQKFNVKGFPSLIIFDPQKNQQMGTTGYLPGGGKAFGEYLLKIVADYSGYKAEMQTLEAKTLSLDELKNLFNKSIELNIVSDTNRIVKIGIASDKPLFFLIERYRFLADEGQIHSKEALKIKQQLLSLDKNNTHLTQYTIALIEFQTLCGDIRRKETQTASIVAPLVSYIQAFGESDKENLWRLKMIISQVYLDENKMTEALKYAQESYDTAPLSVQTDLARAVQNIRSQIHANKK